MDAPSQNCLAKLTSCSGQPVNTRNPGGEISWDSWALLGGSLGPLSMATQDASPKSLLLSRPARLREPSRCQQPPAGSPSYWRSCWGPRTLVAPVKPTFAAISGLWASPSLGASALRRVLSCPGLSEAVGEHVSL
jgi:hypothetical protein